MTNIINKITKANGALFTNDKILSTLNEDEINLILNKTSFLNKNTSIVERLYYINNSITSKVKCNIC